MKRLYLILCALALLAAAATLFWQPLQLWDLWQHDRTAFWMILLELRVPRTILALVIGAGLGVSGAALQGLLRNPLAAPDILGTSTGAALGAVVTVYWLAFTGTAALTVGAMTGAVLALGALLLLAGRGPSTETLVLAGVAISALGGALTNLALSLAPSPYALYDVLFWLLGSLADRSRDQIFWCVPPMLIGIIMLLRTSRDLDQLALGDEVAQSLGVELARLRRSIIIASAMVVGASVAAAGAIGFIGLVVPHLVRPFVRQRPGRALLPSALAGAILLSLADMAVRFNVMGQELKLGVLTAMIGAPFFLWLILSRRREHH